MNKTITTLAIVTAFLIGTSMSFAISDYTAEAKKEEGPNPVANAIDRLTAVIQNTATIGPQGPEGPPGPIGPPNTLVVTERDITLVTLGGFKIADVILACDAGEQAVGSAIQSALPNTFARTRIIVDAPNNDDPNISQWEMKIENPNVGQQISFNVSVICAKLGN